MIDVKSAVGIAAKFLKEMYPEEQSKDLRLEEVGLSDDEKLWLITLSFIRTTSSSELESVLGAFKREFKRIEVEAETGKVRCMMIRNPYGESAQAY